MRFSWFLAAKFLVSSLGVVGCASAGSSEPAEAEPIGTAPAEAAPSAAPSSVAPAGAAGRFVVHEWGTFTGMQGIDGLAVEGLEHESESLPAFVHTATSPAVPSPYRLWGDVSLRIPARHVNSKMETPVVYFYSDVPRQVKVRVDFEGGLLSEWFPRASVAPAAARGAVDLRDVHTSTLAWDVALTPLAAGPPGAMPDVARNNPWALARDVGAAIVTAKGDGDAAAEAEHYLFYRGLARMKLPLRVIPLGEAGAALQNVGDAPIDGVFLLEVGATTARFTSLGRAIDRGASAPILHAGAPRANAEVVKDLGRAITAMLVEHGLYADEARAMVKTWQSTWFASEGTRALYVIPRKTVDATLKMSITPAPDRLERVLVGRQEFLTPAATREIEVALRERATSADPGTREAATRRLARLGRFLEPSVRLVAAASRDAAVRSSASEVISAYPRR